MSTDIRRALAMLAVNYNVLSPYDALTLLAEEKKGRSLTQLMIQSITESDMLKSIAKEMGYKFYDMHSRDQEYILDESIVRKCDIKMLTDHSALPLLDKSGKVILAMANPLDMDILMYLKSRFPDTGGIALVPKSQVQSRLLYITDEFESRNPSGNVVPEFIEYLLQRAVGEGASDIHMRFMYDSTLMLRLRVDGVLRQIPFPPSLKGRESEVAAAMMAKTTTMDSSNTREPQDGTFSFPVAGRSVDARVGMLPQIAGPNITVRILDPLTLRRRLEDMGFDIDVAPLFQTPSEVAKQAIENDVHIIGVSSQAAGHKTLIPELYEILKKEKAEDIMIIAGGVIPQQDYEFLYKHGVAAIFGPGTVIPIAADKILDILAKKVG